MLENKRRKMKDIEVARGWGPKGAIYYNRKGRGKVLYCMVEQLGEGRLGKLSTAENDSKLGWEACVTVCQTKGWAQRDMRGGNGDCDIRCEFVTTPVLEGSFIGIGQFTDWVI